MRRPDSCIYAKTKVQISCAVTAQLISNFGFATYRVQSLLSKSEISSLWPSSVTVQTGLCRTWSKNPKTGFLVTRLKLYRYC